MAAFNYSLVPMSNPETQIRILRLQPGKDDAEVHIVLETYEFDACPPYVAISYTWGDEQPMVPITVNGREFRVRVNCWYSLWQLQYHKEDRAIWIDSTCIDQSNIPEKNAQVAMMGRIYSKAALTACSLGPGQNLAHARRLINPPASNDSFRTLETERNSLRELQHRSYFRRIWIKQEIILSKDLRLYCGIDTLAWNTYADILGSFVAHDVRNLKNTLEQHPKSRDLGNNVHKTLVDGRAAYHASPRDSSGVSRGKEAHHEPWAQLWAILEQYGDAECHDRHDKVYALISLLPEDVRSRLDLEIDYAQPLLSLCLEIIQKYIREFSATRGAHESPTIPASIWTSMANMIQHWVRPELSDPQFRSFAALRSTPAGTPAMIDSNQIENMDVATKNPKYAKLEVWYQYPISSLLNVGGLLAYQYLQDPDEISQMSGTYKHYLSDTMPVEHIPAYLKPLMHHSHEDGEFYGAKGAFSLTGLPPNLQVRIVVAQFETSSDYNFYLVPPNIELGDEIVMCRLENPHEDGFYLPIFRQIANAPWYSVLVGWALLLGNDGSLQRIVSLEHSTHALMLRAEDTSSSSVGESVFYAHYEDLILEALLVQDSSKYVMHPRTHIVHPSFLVWISPVRADTTIGSVRKSEKGKGKRGVGFA